VFAAGLLHSIPSTYAWYMAMPLPLSVAGFQITCASEVLVHAFAAGLVIANASGGVVSTKNDQVLLFEDALAAS
jgi:hypothetical protein